MKALGLQTLPIADIDATKRLRQVNQAQADLLGQNIAECGHLRSPIEVRAKKKGGYELIAGGHRLRAVIDLGWTEIPAFVFEASDDEARLFEIDENLIRHELNPLDRAVFLAERKEVYLRLHPETAAGVAGGKARQNSANDIMSFAADTAEKCGLTERSIQRAVKIASGLSVGARSRIAGTWLSAKQGELLSLIKSPEGEQHKILDILLAESPKAKTVEAARKIVLGVIDAVKSPEDIQLQKLLAAWIGAGSVARKRFMDQIAQAEAA